MKNYYKVEENYCNCHSETCCCNPWRVVDTKGKKIATFFNKKAAHDLVDLLSIEFKDQ